MMRAEEIRKGIVDSDTKEVTEILEILDEDSMALVKGYLFALADRQRLEKIRLAVI